MDRRKALSLLAALPLVGRFFKPREPQKPRVVGTLWFTDGRRLDFVDHGGPKAPAFSAAGAVMASLMEHSTPHIVEDVDAATEPPPGEGWRLIETRIVGDGRAGHTIHRLYMRNESDPRGELYCWSLGKPESKWDGQA